MRVTHRLFLKSSFPLPQESSRGIHTGVNETVLSIHKAIPPFPWGRKMSRTKIGYFVPTKKRWELHLSHLQAQKKQDGLPDNNLFCSVLCRFSCHPLAAPFLSTFLQQRSCHLWCVVCSPSSSPQGQSHVFIFMLNERCPGESHMSGCEQGLLRDQLLHNHTHSTCLLTPHPPPHRDHVLQHIEGCGVSTEPSWCSSMKPRHTENRKTKALLWTGTHCTVQQEFHMESPQAPPNKSTCLTLNAFPSPSTHSKTTRILW